MANILVAGLINIETTLKIDGFPFEYTPVRYPFFGINSTVSGVGYNIVKALLTLGDQVTFLSMVGDDAAGTLVRDALGKINAADTHVLTQLSQTPQSVILYEPSGRRTINTDLKDIQEQTYPLDRAEAALRGVDLAVLCNINFSRPLLSMAKSMDIPIATDIHAISDLNDHYNRDYMAHARILFQSHERLYMPPEVWARKLWEVYGVEIVVVGMGGDGALLAVRHDNFMERIPAVHTRQVVNTIGAGDALFSSFLHTYLRTRDPYEAIRKATVFASWKIGAVGAAEGFLPESDLDRLYQQTTTA
jgi:acarbose 7IV-phosphotransferase